MPAMWTMLLPTWQGTNDLDAGNRQQFGDCCIPISTSPAATAAATGSP
jgi:hypothetical protein